MVWHFENTAEHLASQPLNERSTELALAYGVRLPILSIERMNSEEQHGVDLVVTRQVGRPPELTGDPALVPSSNALPTRAFPGWDDLPIDHPLAAAMKSAQGYASCARSQSTREGYAADWRNFESWCSTAGVPALPANPTTVGLYLASQADSGFKVATMQRRLTAISAAHKAAGYRNPGSMIDSPALAEVWHGIRRRLG